MVYWWGWNGSHKRTWTEKLTDCVLFIQLLPVTVWWQLDDDSRCISKIKMEQVYNTVAKHSCHGI
jgi:hypothetical protein